MKCNSVWFEPSNNRWVLEFKGEKGETWFRYLDRDIESEMLRAWLNSLINEVKVRV